MKKKKLKSYEQQIRSCVKCGACQAHCPAYLEQRKEGAVARGKIALAAALLDGETRIEDRFIQDMSMCLMCGSCVNTCPNKVPTDKIVGAVRREIVEKKGLGLLGRGISTLLGSRSIMKGVVKGGALLSPLFCKKIPASSGLHLRFPPSTMVGRTLPQIPYQNLFDRYPEFLQGEEHKPVLGFFAGCSITYAYPEIGMAMVDILHGLGFSLFIPRQQRCCGIPALSSGNGKLVEELAAANINAFESQRVTHIITACASCNGGLQEYEDLEEAAPFIDKVIDFNVFMQEEGLLEELDQMPKWEKRKRVTYHDPCHLKSQGITSEPRRLLRVLPNIEFVEMEGASLCCGLGGTFSATHYECSKSIGAKKIPGLLESGADKIATSCPGCIMQLQDIINHGGASVEAVHILELVQEALRGPTATYSE